MSGGRYVGLLTPFLNSIPVWSFVAIPFWEPPSFLIFTMAVADQGFFQPGREGAPIPKVGLPTDYLAKIFPENWMKMKGIPALPLNPPMLRDIIGYRPPPWTQWQSSLPHPNPRLFKPSIFERGHQPRAVEPFLFDFYWILYSIQGTTTIRKNRLHHRPQRNDEFSCFTRR